MAFIMNRYDVQDALDHYSARSNTPNYATAARILADLVSWTDSTSDGWPYWNKPSRAARRLQELLQGWHRRYIDGDYSDLDASDLDAAVKPIKAFLTRQRTERDGDYLASATILRESIVRALELQVTR